MAYAAATTDRDTKYSDGKIISVKMEAVKICKGGFVCTGNNTGYATNTVTATHSDYLGVAFETVDNSGGSAGDKSIRIQTYGVHSFVAASADQTWVGGEVYWSTGSSGDNVTVVNKDPGVEIKVGRVVEVVSETEVRVRIDNYACNYSASAS